MTHKQIAEWVRVQTGVPVATSTVSVALQRAGFAEPAKKYEKHLPWQIHSVHSHHYAARMLRVMARRDSGQQVAEANLQRLDSWLGTLKNMHAVVAYVPESEEGFFYVDGDPVDGVPILPPAERGKYEKLRAKVLSET